MYLTFLPWIYIKNIRHKFKKKKKKIESKSRMGTFIDLIWALKL